MRLCGARNSALNEHRIGTVEWFESDAIRMCYLPHDHAGEHHWRVPTSIRHDDPHFDELVRMAEIAKKVGHDGAAVVNAAWAKVGLHA